jgi:MoaA/NifB/PqqE/SkfB family radical SAM enzyme
MVTRLHILLTYKCSLRCNHCYVYSHQRAPGKISLRQISQILKDGRKLPDVKWVYFGGGEPFTQYPLLLKAVQRARHHGYEVGVETNGYFARTESAGLRFLRPIVALGVKDIRISNDRLHYKNPDTSPANRALNATQQLGIPTTLVRIPFPEEPGDGYPGEVESTNIIEPRLMFSGRAADTMSPGRRAFHSRNFTECPNHNLKDPESLYIDTYGFVQICPGIAIGNIFEEPLDQIVENYKVQEHAIFRHLYAQGPSGLIEYTNLNPAKKFVDACHCCYTARLELIDRYPDLLGPRQVYDLTTLT